MDDFPKISFAPCSCGSPTTNFNRRKFLATSLGAGLGVAGALSGCASVFSPELQPKDGMIDVHHHHIPPFYLEEYRERISGSRGGKLNPAWLSWSPERALEAMDAAHVSTAVLSLTSPGVWFGDAIAAARTARQVNEYAAELGRTQDRKSVV